MFLPHSAWPAPVELDVERLQNVLTIRTFAPALPAVGQGGMVAGIGRASWGSDENVMLFCVFPVIHQMTTSSTGIRFFLARAFRIFLDQQFQIGSTGIAGGYRQPFWVRHGAKCGSRSRHGNRPGGGAMRGNPGRGGSR